MSLSFQITPDEDSHLKSLADIIPEAGEKALHDYVRTLYAKLKSRTPKGEKKPRKRRRRKGQKKPYVPGTLWKSWQYETGPAYIQFYTEVPYAHVLEYGKYKGVGPRTEAGEGGIYSKQAVGGMMRPLLDDAGMLDQILERIAKEIRRAV
jgi:hypothetical protein